MYGNILAALEEFRLHSKLPVLSASNKAKLILELEAYGEEVQSELDAAQEALHTLEVFETAFYKA